MDMDMMVRMDKFGRVVQRTAQSRDWMWSGHREDQGLINDSAGGGKRSP
jgi:hypothetical protein